MKISLEEAIEIATKRFLLPGLKPEDYSIFGKHIAVRIAHMIVKEAKHIMEVEPKLYSYEHILSYKLGEPIVFKNKGIL